MSAITEAIKEGFQSWKSVIGFVIGIIVTLFGMVSQLFGWLDKFITAPYLNLTTFAVIYLGLLAFILTVCRNIIRKKNPVTAGIIIPSAQPQDQFYYSEKQRKWAKIMSRLLPGLSLIFVIWGILIAMKVHRNCEQQKTYLGVKIYKFSDTDKDPFSASIFSYLQEHLTTKDSLTIDTVNQYINLNKIKRASDAIVFLGCFGKGLIVYGNRGREESSFYCKIFIKNIRDQISDTIGPTNKIITIQDPSYFHFEFEKQYEVVSKSVLALINYQRGEYEQTIELLEPITKNDQLNNPKFIAICYLVLGNSYFRKKDLSTAFEQYRKGQKYDQENILLQKNFEALTEDSFNINRFVIQDLPNGFTYGIYESTEDEWYHKNVWKVLAPFKKLMAIEKFGCIYENSIGLWDGAIYSKTGVTKIFFNAPSSVFARTEFDKFLITPNPAGYGYPLDFLKD